MGLFRQQPEDPAEWGGLPAEPLDGATPAEELAVAGAVDATAFGLGGATGFESVIVALPQTPVDPPSAEDD